jgi:pectin methylesterase-like acyl-CoA thioesterase
MSCTISEKMNIRVVLRVAYTAPFLLALLVGAASRAIITVDENRGADYMGIQGAIISASPRDMLVVYSGEYHENVIIKGGKAHDI